MNKLYEAGRYISHLDHYLDEVDYHLISEQDLDEALIHCSDDKDHKERLLGNMKDMTSEAMVREILESKYDKATKMEKTSEPGYSVERYRTDLWIFTEDELERFIKEVKAEVLQGIGYE